jgi:hypothetical protein
MAYMEIKESKRELLEYWRKNPLSYKPLQFLITMQMRSVLHVADIAQRLNVSENEIMDWAALYEIGGIDLLLDYRIKHRRFIDFVFERNKDKIIHPRSVAGQLRQKRSLKPAKIKVDKTNAQNLGAGGGNLQYPNGARSEEYYYGFGIGLEWGSFFEN